MRIAALCGALLWGAASGAVAGEIYTGVVPARTGESVACGGVNASATDVPEMVVEILSSSGGVLTWARCRPLDEGASCWVTITLPGPFDFVAPYACRIGAPGVSAARLRGALSNRTTGASSDAR
jgi:hypothetical protein